MSMNVASRDRQLKPSVPSLAIHQKNIQALPGEYRNRTDDLPESLPSPKKLTKTLFQFLMNVIH